MRDEAAPAPVLSVILPVYNGAPYIRAAIDSILTQTFTDFELIVIDDGSTDATAAIVAALDDPRLHFIRQENRGLAATLNRGLSLARGRYIARHDHDDMSLPARFEKQVAYLDTHPDCALLGTHSTIWAGDSPTERGHRHPCDPGLLCFDMLFDCFLVHGSVMMRRDAVKAMGGYTSDPLRQPPEDFDLWSRMTRHYGAANLPEALLVYREVPGSITRTISFTDRLVAICSENLAYAAGLAAPNADTQDIAALIHNQPALLSPRPDFSRMQSVLRRAAKAIDRRFPNSGVMARAETVAARLKSQRLRQTLDRLPLWAQRLIKYSHAVTRKVVR